MKTLNELAKDIRQNAVDKGFYEKPAECGTKLMLVVSELSEALEADRKNRRAKMEEFRMRENDSDVALADLSAERQFQWNFEDHIKDSFEDEIADAMIRLLDLSASQGIDIERHIELKMRYNALRPRKHGKRY
jgi:NTP pyrophosphatase (non-canonical NTP hydrolase)